MPYEGGFPGLAAALDQITGCVAWEAAIAVDDDLFIVAAVAEFDALGEGRLRGHIFLLAVQYDEPGSAKESHLSARGYGRKLLQDL
jgi:hypothetical protein